MMLFVMQKSSHQRHSVNSNMRLQSRIQCLDNLSQDVDQMDSIVMYSVMATHVSVLMKKERKSGAQESQDLSDQIALVCSFNFLRKTF